jgi:hypothetical protein
MKRGDDINGNRVEGEGNWSAPALVVLLRQVALVLNPSEHSGRGGGGAGGSSDREAHAAAEGSAEFSQVGGD